MKSRHHSEPSRSACTLPWVCADTASAANGADVVITMLGTDDAFKGVLFDQGVANAVSSDTTVIDMSSIPPHSAIAYAGGAGRLVARCAGVRRDAGCRRGNIDDHGRRFA